MFRALRCISQRGSRYFSLSDMVNSITKVLMLKYRTAGLESTYQSSEHNGKKVQVYTLTLSNVCKY